MQSVHTMRLKGHIWESRGDMFWLWSISRCCDVARSWCLSWKFVQKCVSVSCNVSRSCDHLLEMGLKILLPCKILLIHIFSGGASRSCDVAKSFYSPQSKHISSSFPDWAHHGLEYVYDLYYTCQHHESCDDVQRIHNRISQ